MSGLASQPDEALRAILLTVDGKGRAAKEASLEELLRRAAAPKAFDEQAFIRDAATSAYDRWEATRSRGNIVP